MPAATGYIGVLKNSEVTFTATDYANQMTRARLVPEVPSQQIRTLVPDGTLSDVDSAAWTFEIAGIQKLNTGGLAKMLNDATPGSEIEVTWQPVKGVVGQPEYTFMVIAQPVPIGGDQGGFATFEAVLQVVGAPVVAAISS
jgi:hypothetical protein